MADASDQLLLGAIARNCGLVLSLPSAGLLRHHKSRFLQNSPEGVWIAAPATEELLIAELISIAAPAGVSFKSGTQKVIFTSPIREFASTFEINRRTTTTAVLLALPAKLSVVQRRNAYRVRVFDESLKMRLWRIAPRAYINERPSATQEILAEPRDLSLGGIGVTLRGRDGGAPLISVEDRLRVELIFADTNLVLEARVREPGGRQTSGAVRTGLQFKNMDGDLEGRQKLAQLTRLIGALQREEARRCRLGIA